MKKVLQSFDRNKEYLELDTRQIFETSEEVLVCGWYKWLDKILTAIYVMDNDVYFLNDDKSILLESSILPSVDEIDGSSAIFMLYQHNKIITEFKYDFDKSLHGVAPFDWFDEEDFDWGMFLKRLISDKERQKRIIERSKSAK